MITAQMYTIDDTTDAVKKLPSSYTEIDPTDSTTTAPKMRGFAPKQDARRKYASLKQNLREIGEKTELPLNKMVGRLLSIAPVNGGDRDDLAEWVQSWYVELLVKKEDETAAVKILWWIINRYGRSATPYLWPIPSEKDRRFADKQESFSSETVDAQTTEDDKLNRLTAEDRAFLSSLLAKQSQKRSYTMENLFRLAHKGTNPKNTPKKFNTFRRRLAGIYATLTA